MMRDHSTRRRNNRGAIPVTLSDTDFQSVSYSKKNHRLKSVPLFMDRWESLIDKKIREAMEAGEFDDLTGAGQPIDLAENPYEDPAWRTAHRLLRNAGFAPSWIEERKDIDAELEAARILLARKWTILRNARQTHHEESARERWKRGEAEFRVAVQGLNRRIDAWNLKTPAVAFHRNRIDVEREIDRIKG